MAELDTSRPQRQVRNVKFMEMTKALTIGQIEAVLSKKDDILALTFEELDKLVPILKASRVAANDCCTGG